ncbi:Concanavalin A-like lectin/glucanase subgroup [Penicillium chrysogenum]|nr:Concanavalin A-like lectin/glucanase subgroup [Penicillium chrysogenum]
MSPLSKQNAQSQPPANQKETETPQKLLPVTILAAILIPVEIIQNRYPNYTPLNYILADNYSFPTFFDQFTYFTEDDSTNGFVVYVNNSTARPLNLTYASESSVILRVDASTPNPRSGRNSVRFESRNTYASASSSSISFISPSAARHGLLCG